MTNVNDPPTCGAPAPAPPKKQHFPCGRERQRVVLESTIGSLALAATQHQTFLPVLRKTRLAVDGLALLRLRLLGPLPALWTAVLLLCCGLAARAEGPVPKPNAGVLLEIGGQRFIYEVIRHMYRWYLDETDIEKHIGKPTVSVWLRSLHPPLDPGDKSKFAELWLPALQVRVTLKKTDYRIEELNLLVKGSGYRIANVVREAPPATPEGFQVMELDLPPLVDYLFNTRNQREYPAPALADHLHRAVLLELGNRKIPTVDGVHVCHVGPLSPVSNELWVFWENGRMLIKFTSDLDLSNPAVWGQENLKVRTYDIDQQVVVSQSEVPGSNAFLNRDQVGRVLYNCIVLGQRVAVAPMHR
jgi:hypothetical protein